MKKVIIYLIFTASTLIFSHNTPYTDEIMNFLSKSKTIWLSSEKWKDVLRENGNIVETAYAKTHLMEYFGIVARSLRLNESMIKAYFRVERDNDQVMLRSEIDTMEIQKAHTQKDVDRLRQLACSMNEKHNNQSDAYSRCTITIEAFFDEPTCTLQIKRHARCVTKMQYDSFIHTLHSK